MKQLLLCLLAVALTACTRGMQTREPNPGAPVAQPPAAAPAPAPPPEPAPHPEPVPEPPFTVNGVTFTRTPNGEELGCSEPLHPASTTELERSELKVNLPSGYLHQGTKADACDGRVASLASVFTAPEGQRLIVARWTMFSYIVPDVAPLPVTIAGRPAVRIGDALILVEAWGITHVEGLPYEQAAKVAEALLSPPAK